MKGKRYIILLLAMLLVSHQAFAVCGSTDYSGSSGRLYNMVVYVLTMCSYVMQLMYAIASLFSLYSATSIYVKMQAGEEGFTKSIMMLVGSMLFLLFATTVMPAFFGFNYGVTDSLF